MAHRTERRVFVGRAEGKLVEVRLAQEDCTSLTQTCGRDRIATCDVPGTNVGRCRGRNALEIDDVLERNRNAMKRAAILSPSELRVRLSGLRKSLVRQDGDVRVDRRIPFGDSRQAVGGGSFGGDLAGAKRPRQFGNGAEASGHQVCACAPAPQWRRSSSPRCARPRWICLLYTSPSPRDS